ncbi:MAG: putative secreted protein with C-terminal beta-propeller domain [Paraglaciecola sp.]|jgi:uncharacterized secreted protein with C-terminal beta-propeller domain
MVINGDNMRQSKIAGFSLIILLTAALGACSGSDSSDVPDTIERPTEAPQINPAQSFAGPLTKAGQSSVSRFIKNGIFSATQNSIASTGDPIPATSPVADSSTGFSTTNTQEAGIDEADRIEYDGDYLYLAAYPQWIDGDTYQAHVRVMQRNEDFSLREVKRMDLANQEGNISGIYHAEQRLAVVSTNSQNYSIDNLSITPWFETENRVALDIYDTGIAAQSEATLQAEFDGNLLSSRRIDNQLYLVISYVPSVDNLIPGATSDAELLANYLTILDTPDTQIMPKMYINGTEEALNSIEDCAIPASATENDGYAQLVSVIRINLQQPDDMSASCLSMVAEVIYMSPQHLYLTATLDNQTALHKIALDNDLSYQASGTVEGIIGWRSAANLRLSEKDGYLRVVSSDYQQGDPVHRLSIVNQQGSELETVAVLPNDASPEPLGKPGEDIFAVRFFEDRAYIVTFEQIDPLYVLDLANPLAPQLVGALEIPGFSSYLHPLDNQYLLGVGQQVGSNIPPSGPIPIEPVTQQGMKVSLFDVSDPANPIEVNYIVKESAYTPVEYDYRALAVFNDSGRYQFSMPVEQWGRPVSTSIWQQSNSLILLEVDTQAAQPELLERATINAYNEPGYYINSGDDRSVIHGAHVYYIHGNQVWHSLWQSNAEVTGPY